MTCYSCHYSAWNGKALVCMMKQKAFPNRCEKFKYCPGTDEKERETK
jgi:hypothetical protein